MLTDGIAYVKIKSFSSERALTQFNQIFPELHKAKAVILDIRDNTGGNDSYARDLVMHFTDIDTIRSKRVFAREHIGSHRAFARNSNQYKKYLGDTALIDLGVVTKANKLGQKILAPLSILIDARTRSAAENFLIDFDCTKRATLIGQPTGGSTGQPYFFTLAGGIRACIVAPKNTYPDGREFVGIGIKPDIEVIETIEDFLNDRDVVLEKAKKYLRSRINMQQ